MKNRYFLAIIALLCATMSFAQEYMVLQNTDGSTVRYNVKDIKRVYFEKSTYQGEGTLASPFTVADALAKCAEVGETATTQEYYAQGYVTSIKEISTNYGNATFEIADAKGDTTTTILVYRAKGLENKNITDENLLKIGDQVIICGKLVNYKGNTPEFTQGCYIYSLNGKTKEEGGDTPTPETIGSKDNPKTVADALAAINALESGKTTTAFYYVKGKVKTVKTTDENITKYKNIDYTIVDEGADNELTVFRGKYLDKADFTVDNKVKEGDVVIVYGQLLKYAPNDSTITPEIAKDNYLVSIVKGEGGDTPTPTGENLLTNGDFEIWSDSLPTNWKSTTSASSATLEQSSDAHAGTYAVKVIHVSGSNKRLAYKEISLKAGTYTMKFYVKATDAAGASINPGYVPLKDDGSVGSYVYNGYVDSIPTNWREVTASFTLTEKTTLNLVVMVSKKSGSDVLIDDFELTTTDGGIAEGGEEGGNEGGEDTTPAVAKGSGTEADPYNPVAAINYAVSLDGKESTNDVYVKGKIATIKYTYSAQYGTATYTISEDGTEKNLFTVYGSYYMASEQAWVEGDTQIAVGDEVIVCGKVINYNGNTPEFANKKNWLVSITKAN